MRQKNILQHFKFNPNSEGLPNLWLQDATEDFCRFAIAVNAVGLDWWQTGTEGEFARFGRKRNGVSRASTTLGVICGRKFPSVRFARDFKSIFNISQTALNPTRVLAIEKLLRKPRGDWYDVFKPGSNTSGLWPDHYSIDTIPNEVFFITGDDQRDRQRLANELTKAEEIWNSNLKGGTKVQLINARVGQGEFCTGVLKRAGGLCEVTGVDNRAMLIASHIHPWAADDATNKDRLDPNNGLSLTPNLDKLFDRGFISFDDEGRLLVKTEDEKLLRQLLPYSSADPVGLIKKPTSEQCVFLAKHREIYKFVEGDRFILNLIMPSGAKGASKSARPTTRAA